jgi:hypothetical protein
MEFDELDGFEREFALEAMRAALEAAGVGELIDALSNANRVLDWFADELNWREEELSEGIHFSAEWKIGFDPMELARHAKAKSVAALAKVTGAPPDDARTAPSAPVDTRYAGLPVHAKYFNGGAR